MPELSANDRIMAVSAPAVIVRQPARQVLADGSVVELRDEARITPDFSDKVRRLVLEAGEAHFDVAKNPERPFVVEVAGVRVRAVGTAFAVRPSATQVEVIVTEGRVAVAPAGSDEVRLVDAGGRVVIDRRLGTIAIEQLASEQVAGELAWRVPRLEFSGTALREVIAEFNRHNETRLVLADQATGELRLSGIIRADNVSALLALLETSHGLQVERGVGLIVVRRAR